MRFSNTADGTGIGLYMIKNIVRRNGGSINVKSAPDKGTSFYLSLKEYEAAAE